MPAKKTSTKTPAKKTSKKMAAHTPAVILKSVKVAKPAKVTKPLVAVAPTPIVAMKKPARNLHLGMHAIIAGSAICVMLLLGIAEREVFSTNLSSAEDSVPVTIGLEHTAPLSLSVLFAKKENAGYVSISNQSSETIHLNLPSSWKRTEVTGADLKDVVQGIPNFGFSRWTLPGKAGMKLLMDSAPSAVFFDSVSASTAAIDLKTIDLTTKDVSNKIVLVQKQTLVPLWVSAE